jgi:hypothetical protein
MGYSCGLVASQEVKKVFHASIIPYAPAPCTSAAFVSDNETPLLLALSERQRETIHVTITETVDAVVGVICRPGMAATCGSSESIHVPVAITTDAADVICDGVSFMYISPMSTYLLSINRVRALTALKQLNPARK